MCKSQETDQGQSGLFVHDNRACVSETERVKTYVFIIQNSDQSNFTFTANVYRAPELEWLKPGVTQHYNIKRMKDR